MSISLILLEEIVKPAFGGGVAEPEFAGGGKICRVVYVSLTIKYELSAHRNLKAALV
jgi:hypothetical protein